MWAFTKSTIRWPNSISVKLITRPSNIVRFALWTAFSLLILRMATPLLHKIINKKPAVVGGVKNQEHVEVWASN